MNRIVPLFLLLLLPACGSRVHESLASPTGHFVLLAEVSGDEAGATRRMCVRLRITDQKTNKELLYQTGASDYSKWAVGWRGDTPVLFSSDIGTYAYEVVGGSILERPANDAEKEVGRTAYEKKYGKRPGF